MPIIYITAVHVYHSLLFVALDCWLIDCCLCWHVSSVKHLLFKSCIILQRFKTLCIFTELESTLQIPLFFNAVDYYYDVFWWLARWMSYPLCISRQDVVSAWLTLVLWCLCFFQTICQYYHPSQNSFWRCWSNCGGQLNKNGTKLL